MNIFANISCGFRTLYTYLKYYFTVLKICSDDSTEVNIGEMILFITSSLSLSKPNNDGT